jgi:hypothetical protein
VAANIKGEPLYYEATTEYTRMVDDITKPRYQDDGKTPLVDATGKQLYEQKEETYKVGEIKPCYATDNAWKDLVMWQPT